MFTVTVEQTFTASHQLVTSKGTEELHSHDWVIAAAFKSKSLDSDGFAVDFEILKTILDQECQKFVGGKIEDFEYFKNVSATAENLAKYLFFSIKNQLNGPGKLEYVEVTEATGCKAKYSE